MQYAQPCDRQALRARSPAHLGAHDLVRCAHPALVCAHQCARSISPAPSARRSWRQARTPARWVRGHARTVQGGGADSSARSLCNGPVCGSTGHDASAPGRSTARAVRLRLGRLGHVLHPVSRSSLPAVWSVGECVRLDVVASISGVDAADAEQRRRMRRRRLVGPRCLDALGSRPGPTRWLAADAFAWRRPTTPVRRSSARTLRSAPSPTGAPK